MDTLSRRVIGLLVLLLLAGCASPPRIVEPDGTYCFRIGKTNRQWRTCTTTPIPSEVAEADAKRFEAQTDLATLYVVRRRWADSAYRVPVDIDGLQRVDTIPASFIRLRLKPGPHRLTLSWRDQVETTTVIAHPGEVAFVEIEGSAWIGATHYRWQAGDEAGARDRAARSKLIADLDLR